MPRMYLKLEDKRRKKTFFVGWSTVTDTVNSDVMDAKAFEENVRLTDEQRESLEKTGCSHPHYTISELLNCSDDFPTRKSLMKYCNQ